MTDTRSMMQIRKDVIAMIEQHTPGRWTMDKCPNAELVTALRNMTALANNMRETIEGGSFATRYEIPYGYFNAAYVAMEQAESFQKRG